MNLQQTLSDIASRWNYKLSEVSPGVFAVDVQLKLKDGATRFQYAYARMEAAQNGQQRIYITSRCGIYHPNLNFYSLLRETGNCNYATITIGNGKDKDNKPVEVVMVQAAPLEQHTSPELLDATLFEVANMADYIESRYFGDDIN